MNDICQILGTEYPIIQGAMARIAESSLAAAVSNGGGLGIIASGGYDADWLRDEIKKVRSLTDKPFGVNLMLLMPNIDELIKVVCEEKVPVVTTGAGNPGKYMKELKEAGIKVIPVVASVALAIRVERAGADAIIAEGTEAGGHIGEIATMALTPQVADAVSIPVLAAGGIADGRGVAAAYMLGAKGVQVGTRFVVAKECIVSQNYKDAIIKAKDTDTCATGRSTGHPVRVIKNKLAREILAIEKSSVGDEVQAAIDKVGIGALGAAVFDGDVEHGSVMSGQIAGMVRKEQPAAEMIKEMFEEAKMIYSDRASLF
ncbi:enoyl-[acyl-carrier-protein] reductase FabK [Aminipila terrae]|uniref:Probable nitronate monooxygenase n=1 Tax=Aminipila terrae TaxID=2697030 RepID=A0A6P1MHA5_9FIRM|nr:enoyl-[acyl-carrier-protein] reductase FabK [Aminipila terrae]QHI72563.1 enoyl-[acyl-carrier-protein] reductase FabK [Aminipila terrae]